MDCDTQSARDDLAYMRAIIEAGNSRTAMAGGEAFVAGGLIYGAQCLVQWLGATGLVELSKLGWLVSSLGPTVLFLAWLGWFIWRTRGLVQPRAQKAINAFFAAAGSANLVLVVVVGMLAARKESIEIWELYPCFVFAMQGAGWLVAFMLRKQLWLLAVALGWFVATVILGWAIGTTTYILIAALSLLLLMALPGFVMMRLARAGE
ncbi:MAG: hypothetical protein HOP13_02005 [Alphaproteobacteria bacterium]|nr:hypothetical protein [Alphaproteobacteria bacterium]